mmetsp:Transcript_7864/g.23679  ORF Transcript_7864/g.23679 Transcript_7864/m.23679 type:complete len:215 (+) Transcript_7864:86-730(+)
MREKIPTAQCTVQASGSVPKDDDNDDDVLIAWPHRKTRQGAACAGLCTHRGRLSMQRARCCQVGPSLTWPVTQRGLACDPAGPSTPPCAPTFLANMCARAKGSKICCMNGRAQRSCLRGASWLGPRDERRCKRGPHDSRALPYSRTCARGSSALLAQLVLLEHLCRLVQDGIEHPRDREHAADNRACGGEEVVERLGRVLHQDLDGRQVKRHLS